MSDTDIEIGFTKEMQVEFADESIEEISKMENLLFEFKQNPNNIEPINGVFRVDDVHMIFRPTKSDILFADRREMVKYNEEILPVLRLYQPFHILPKYEAPEEAIIVIVESP